MIIAVDFDGTLHFSRGGKDGIGTPNTPLINKLIDLKNAGNDLILWTCRHDDSLQEAVNWCKEQGLYFDAVNDNIESIKESHTEIYGACGRKIYANVYIDDKAISPKEFVTWF